MGLYLIASDALVTNNVIDAGFGLQSTAVMVENSAGGAAGTPVLANNLVRGGGGLYGSSWAARIWGTSTVTFLNNLLDGGDGAINICVAETAEDAVPATFVTNDLYDCATALYASDSIRISDPALLGAGNVSAWPFLGGGGHLTGASTCCIDTSTAAGAPAFDFENDPRPAGAGVDLGADEY